MEWSTFVPALIGAASALATSAGERIISRFFDRSQRREAHRDADLQVLERVAFEVRDLATEYWANGPDEEHEAIIVGSIVGRLTFLAALIDELFNSNDELLRDTHVSMNRFDTSCTSGAFGVKKRPPEPARCRQIEISAYTLVQRASSLRRKL